MSSLLSSTQKIGVNFSDVKFIVVHSKNRGVNFPDVKFIVVNTSYPTTQVDFITHYHIIPFSERRLWNQTQS